MDETLRAVADPTRRAILRLVRDSELAAGEIATHFPSMSRPAVSQHLRVLTDSGLVEVRPEGNRRLYHWRREGLRDAVVFLDEMWSDRLARLKIAAEREEWSQRTRAERGSLRQQRKGTPSVGSQPKLNTSRSYGTSSRYSPRITGPPSISTR